MAYLTLDQPVPEPEMSVREYTRVAATRLSIGLRVQPTKRLNAGRYRHSQAFAGLAVSIDTSLRSDSRPDNPDVLGTFATAFDHRALHLSKPAEEGPCLCLQLRDRWASKTILSTFE